ncbi:hypothetical protein HS088_TW21G01130 [Tripterygium wilfordii]|uniref:Uncharacterized protein n=1 Tax=Tripterygium wilfordii TaxID=458696 RepID=A0A7J7C4C3_TRIWF|nr:hypothetical protein HS088_TW21G01130 [Tripterygium wilfordii]
MKPNIIRPGCGLLFCHGPWVPDEITSLAQIQVVKPSMITKTREEKLISIYLVAPKGYKGPEQNALGNLLVIFLLGGIFAGVSLDWLWLIGKKNAF